MPLYEYTCLKCKKKHEAIQKFSDPALKTCPSCGGKLAKDLSLSGFHLKGGGWYKDGYASSSEKSGGKSGAGKSSSTAAASTPSSKETSKTSEKTVSKKD